MGHAIHMKTDIGHAHGNIHGACRALGSNGHGTLSGHGPQLEGRKDFSFISKAGYMQARSLFPVSLVLLSHILKLTVNSPCSPPHPKAGITSTGHHSHLVLHF